MSADLHPVIAACSRWLLAAYPAPAGALNAALAHVQAQQAATLAAHLRHPTDLDVQLLHLLGPGGCERLDRLTGAHTRPEDEHHPSSAWRTWVDETVVSWAACLLADPALAARAGRHLARATGGADTGALRRLTHPGLHDTRAAALLRHPDLLEPVAALHRARLDDLLDTADAPAA